DLNDRRRRPYGRFSRRQASLSQRASDRLVPGAKASGNGFVDPPLCTAQEHAREDARFRSATVEPIEGAEHRIHSLLPRRAWFEQGLYDLAFEPIRSLAEHGSRHVALAAWEVMVEARFAESGGIPDVADRNPVESAISKELEQFVDDHFSGWRRRSEVRSGHQRLSPSIDDHAAARAVSTNGKSISVSTASFT